MRNVSGGNRMRIIKHTYCNVCSQFGHPNRVEWIPELSATLTNVEYEQRKASNDDSTQVNPVLFQCGRSAARRVLDQHVLTGKHQPERQQLGVEYPLANVAEQQHERHIVVQGQILQRHFNGISEFHASNIDPIDPAQILLTIQKRQSRSQIQ